jgi:hypothetical protein
LAGCLLEQLLLQKDQGTPAGALVDDAGDPTTTNHGAGRRERMLEDGSLLTMHRVGDCDAHLGEPGAVPGDDGDHRRQRLEPLLGDEVKLTRIGGISTESDSQGIEHGLPVRVAGLDIGEHPGTDFRVVHGIGCRDDLRTTAG